MESKRLVFRELIMADVPRLFEIYSNEEAMKYRRSNPHKSMEDTFQMLRRDAEVKATKYEFRFGIIEKSTQELIGTIMYQPVYTKAIIGYSLDSNFWGKGYATEVVEYFINYLKKENFKLIEAWVMKENIASSKVLLKNGFTKISQTIYPHSDFFKREI